MVFELLCLIPSRGIDVSKVQSKEAMRLANEAWVITERCCYVLQGADVQLFLTE